MYLPELNKMVMQREALLHPSIIQGGMGAGVSGWLLARTVSMMGQLGVVSGTALDCMLARRLQAGDPGGQMRRALKRFPVPEIAERVIERFYIPGGKPENAPFFSVPMFTVDPPRALKELTIAANFVEVFLAKEGHNGVVGINYLEKIQLPNIWSLYGAMLAGVDYVLVGAGIPREIPGVLDGLALHREVSLSLSVEGAGKDDAFRVSFDPKDVIGVELAPLKRPAFLAIIASDVLALTLARKSNGKVDGFVIEGADAGGHNALPRGALKLNGRGEPVYGERDSVDLEKIKALGVPFWLAGSFCSPERLKEAKGLGAEGVQIGTAFAFCKESGLTEGIKERVVRKALAGEAEVFTDPKASPTGFPFKVVALEGSNSEDGVYEARPRVCDLGYLRRLYKREDGAVGYRCPSEPVEAYVKKGGAREDTVGLKCLCNGLLANIGLQQVWGSGYEEMPLVTAGLDLKNIARFVKNGVPSYSASDVLRAVLEEPATACAGEEGPVERSVVC